MQENEPDTPTKGSMLSILEEIISNIKQAKFQANEISEMIPKTDLANLFKNINEESEEIHIDLMGISLVLCLLTYHFLSRLDAKMPKLSSEVGLKSLLNETRSHQQIPKPPNWERICEIALNVEKILGSKNLMNFREEISRIEIDQIFSEDLLGTVMQDSLPPYLRKALAANYTSIISSMLLCNVAADSTLERIIDPFCGSGRLLTSYLDAIPTGKARVFGNELLGVAALLAYVRLLYWFVSRNQEPNFHITSDDAFERIPPPLKFESESEQFFDEYDLVIMNPPFTRYLRLQSEYLEKLFRHFDSYSEYLEKQMGLHVFALFLADRLLSDNGRIAAVLPAPTFYSEYSRGLMRFFARNYHMRYIIGTKVRKAFSEGSDLREVLFIADKKEPIVSTKTTFIAIKEPLSLANTVNIAKAIRSGNYEEFSMEFQRVAQRELEHDWNWIRHLEIGPLKQIARRIRNNDLVKTSKELGLRIVRGFEMYGPEFFFIPNKHWKIVSQENEKMVIVENKKKEYVSIDKNWLVPSLRRPGIYSTRISPTVDDFAINISNPKISDQFRVYLDSNPATWNCAKEKFGPDWITHVHRQLKSKKPFGHLFIVDKFGVTTTGVIANFVDERITASKNFYVVDCSYNTAKMLGAWINSTIFIVLFLASRREIGGSYGRLQIADYQKEPLLIDVSQIDKDLSTQIANAFDKFRRMDLPPLRKQLQIEIRRRIDFLFLRALNFSDDEIPSLLDLIYREVSKSFEDLDTRSRHKPKIL